MKKFFGLVLCLLLVLTGGCQKKSEEDLEIMIGVLKGPTGIGAVPLMAQADNGEISGYHFELLSESSDIAAKVINGELDIAALPTNLAATLYAKTDGQIQIIALNCLSVLYILENGDTVKSFADLKGRTIYCNGQGANPEYVLKYLLNENGLTEEDVTLVFKDASEIVTLMASDQIDLCMLPIPAATTVLMKNENVQVVLDLGKEYEKVSDNSSKLTMGCLVANKEFILEHEEEVELFLSRMGKSIADTLTNKEETAVLIAEYGITPNEKIALEAIDYAGLTFITHESMEEALQGYLEVLYKANLKSVGGKLPDSDFYYKGAQ